MTVISEKYRVVVEDNGHEVDAPGVLVSALGSFSGLSDSEAKHRIRRLIATFSKWLSESGSEGEAWCCADRLVSFRRGKTNTRTYSICPEEPEV